MNTQERYVSSRTVLARISRIFNQSDWREDGILHLFDGIQRMGYNWSTFNDITCEDNLLEVINHKTEIPCDIEEISQVHYNKQRLPISTDQSMLALSEDSYKWRGTGNYYMIDYPYLKFSFEKGFVKVIAKKFKMDDDGFILIPDQQEYKEALRWWVTYQLMLDGYTLKNKEVNLFYAEQKYEENKSIAGSKLKSMSKDRRIQFTRIQNSVNISNLGSNISA